jgi:hypothetical protein
MLDLVSVAEARAHLRLDDVNSGGGPDDAWLAIFIPAISEAVATWLKDEWRLYVPSVDSAGDIIVDSAGDPIPALDTSGNPTARPVVRAATLVELGSQFRFREGEGTDNVVPSDAGHGYVLSKGATALLAGLRKSTVA